jgi:hypothetical protein
MTAPSASAAISANISPPTASSCARAPRCGRPLPARPQTAAVRLEHKERGVLRKRRPRAAELGGALAILPANEAGARRSRRGQHTRHGWSAARRSEAESQRRRHERFAHAGQVPTVIGQSTPNRTDYSIRGSGPPFSHDLIALGRHAGRRRALRRARGPSWICAIFTTR